VNIIRHKYLKLVRNIQTKKKNMKQHVTYFDNLVRCVRILN
jgi:hypothetical protein